ncbi:MAG: radical SAM protein [Oscillospiraceae bacterium]
MTNNGAGHGNIAVFVPHEGCPHRCSFCDQRAISGAVRAPSPDEVQELCRRAIAENQGRTLELAFFGGSFTAIDRALMERLLAAAQPFLGCGISGIRISTRPDAIDAERLALLRSAGVTAIELGAQSTDDAVLQKNGRGHTAQDIHDACALIRRVGFELGLQMMLGLPGAGARSDLASAAELAALGPDTVRIYPALVLKNTEMAQWFFNGTYRPLTLDEGVARAARVMELFEDSDIRIIRVGLHPTGELEKNLLAGPYHPAFRELCEGERMLEKLQKQLCRICLS